MSFAAVVIGIVLLLILFGKSRVAGVHFSIFMLVLIWLVLFGGWDHVVNAYHHWIHPNPPQVVKTDDGIKKIISDLKKPVQGDPGRSVQ